MFIGVGVHLTAQRGGGAPFSVSITGLTDGEARIGDHASIGYTTDPVSATETVKWSNSSNPADAATYGTGASPTDYTAGDEGQLWLHVTDTIDGNSATVSRSAPIRYAPGSVTESSLGDWTIDDDVLNLSLVSDFTTTNLTGTFAFAGIPAGVVDDGDGTLSGSVDGTTEVPETVNFTLTFTDQYGRTIVGNYTVDTVYRAQATGGADLDLSFSIDTTISSTDLLANWTAGGNTLTLVSVSPSLPFGSVSSAGVLTGTTGSSAVADATYTITMQDEYGRQTSDTFTLEVVDAVVFTDVLSDGTGTPVTLTSPTVSSGQPFQRGVARVVMSGALDVTGGTATGMAWRVGSEEWIRFTDETITSTTWEGTLAIPASYLAQGTLQIKPLNGENVTPAEVANVTVSDIFVIMGQSNADGDADVNGTYTATTWDWYNAFATSAFAVKTTDPTFNSGGSIWPDFATELQAYGLPPVTFGPVTIDGSSFSGDDWNPGDTIYNQAVSRMQTKVAVTGGFKGVIWVQAEGDANSVADGEAWDTAFEAMVPAMVAAVPELSGLPWAITMIGEKGAALGIDAVRASILNVIDGNSYAFPGSNLLNEDFGDNVHYGTIGGAVDSAGASAQLERIAKLHMRAIRGAVYGESGTDWPEITSAVADGTTITVNFDRAMTGHTDTTGWSARDANTGDLTITGAAQGSSAAQVVLTTDETMFGAVTVSYGEGESAAGGTLYDTDSDAPSPPRYTYRISAGTAAGAAPALSSAPTISGTPEVGTELTGTDGTYTGTPTPTVGSYQWEISDNGTTGWTDISGATSANYTPVAADEGKFVRRAETASNAVGSIVSRTAATAEIAAAGSAGIVTNGDFTSDLSDWTQTGTVFQWSSGAVDCSASRGVGGALFLRQDITGKVSSGQTVNFSFDIVSRTNGAIKLILNGDTNAQSAFFNTVGTHTGALVVPANTTQLSLNINSAGEMVIDNVSLEIAP